MRAAAKLHQINGVLDWSMGCNISVLRIRRWQTVASADEQSL
jgi:hypothetical protein